MAAPRVSVIVPCRNERAFVERALRSLFDGTFPPAEMEIIVVDGVSDDGTRQILERLAWSDRRLRIVDNPRRSTPVALNRGILAARGDIIVRADAHTIYPRDYVEVLVRTLAESGADLVGCPADATASSEGTWARAIALATSGGFATASPFRDRRRGGEVDTVPFGCWRKTLFQRVGLFDERLLRNQDNEHSSRILRTGGRVHLTVETRTGYLVRGSLRALCGHAAQSGMWNAFTQRLHPYTFRWRHFLPGVFFCGVLVALLAIVLGARHNLPGLALFGVAALSPYLLVDVAVAVHKASRASRLWLAAPIAVITPSYHFSYGFGVVKGWLLVATGAWRRRLGTTTYVTEAAS